MFIAIPKHEDSCEGVIGSSDRDIVSNILISPNTVPKNQVMVLFFHL